MKKLSFLVALLCANMFAFAQLTAPDAAATAPTWPANQVKAIYSTTYGADCNFGEWGSGTAYTSDTYGKKFVTGALGYFGLEFTGMNCSNMEKLHFDIWIAADASMRFFPIWGGTEQGIVKNLTGQQWNSIDIALTEYTSITDWTNVYQIKIADAPNLTFWIGNAYFYTTQAPAVDTDAPTAVTAVVDEVSFYSVKLKVNATDASGSVSFTVKNSDAVVGSANAVSGVDAYINVGNLTPATAYNLSVIASDESGNAAAPIPVSATTLATPAAAPTPTANADNVKSLYCDAYEPAVVVSDYCQFWWASPVVHTVVLGEGNNTLFYDNVQEGASFGWVHPSLDAAGFQKLHLSIYPQKAGTIDLWPVIAPEDSFHEISSTLVAGQWNDVVLDYTDRTFAAFTQIGFRGFSNLGSFFLDNVYFFNEAATALDNTEAGANAQKIIENGQLIIIKNGARYNVAGQEVK